MSISSKTIKIPKKVYLGAFILIVFGFTYPIIVSYPHMKTDRGKAEMDTYRYFMEDWHILQPCRPIGYNGLPIPSCPKGEDGVVVRSICWFGLPGPKLRMCYRDSNNAELGSGKPMLIY